MTRRFGVLGAAAATLLGAALAGADVNGSEASAPPAAAPAPTGDLSSRTEPVASYALAARLDAATQSLHGEGTLSFVNRTATSVSELYFHLYMNAFESERTLFNRSAFTRARSGRAPRRWGNIRLTRLVARELGAADLLPSLEPHSPGDPDDGTDRRVPLPRPLAPGQVLTLELAWDCSLPDIVERSGASRDFYFLGQWFPKLARLESDGTWAHFPFHPHAEFYADFGDYDVRLDVPELMVVGATGRQIESSVAEGRRQLHFRAESVHDFAWTAWPSFERREERIAGVDVHLLYPPGHERNADATLAALRFALPHFNQRYGAYPYSDLTVVHPPAFAASAGGMEYPTLITTGGPWHQAYWSRAMELVTIHELGHQWFYGLVASNEPRWPFLDEGLNSYAESVAAEGLFGPSSASELLGFELSETALHRAGNRLAPRDAPIARAASEFVDFAELGGLVYSRTATLFRTIANVYGPAAFEDALRRYTTRYRFAHPGPDELLHTLEQTLGPEATANVRAALFDGAGVNYSLRTLRSIQKADASVPVDARPFESRVVVHRDGELRFPVQVLLRTPSGERIERRWDGQGRDHVIEHVGPEPVVFAQVDPEDAVLLDDSLLDNALRSEPAAPLATWDRMSYVIELLLGGLAP